jgi:16S rRNA processing protein RimM
MSSPHTAKTQLRVGRLVKAHGLKGAMKVELYTDDPDGRFTPGASFTLQVPDSSPWFGKSVTVREFKWMNSHAVLFLEGVEDRSAAETLVRAILWIDQDAEAESGEDDAWFDHQLVGLTVVRDGQDVGRVARVEHMPAQDLLVITASDDREVLVHFVKAIVPEVDVVAGRHQSSATSTRTRRPSARAVMSVRSALAVRPPRPITRPRSSGCTRTSSTSPLGEVLERMVTASG